MPGQGPGPVVYRYRDVRQWNDGGKLPLPHFLLEHARALRRAYWRAAAGSALERACLAQLRAQLRYLSSTLVARGPALVWEDMHGYAHALEQSEWAHVFLSAATALGRKGHAEAARELAATGFKISRSLDLPAGVRSGGVRSVEDSCSDGVTEPTPCFWFHSRGLGIVVPAGPPVFVLNQHLHAVFNSLLLYEVLSQALQEAPESLAPPDVARSEQRLALGRAVGGLHQLAFGRGKAATDQPPLPRLDDFVDRREDLCAHGRTVPNVWADYAIHPATGKPANISNRGICYYHAHMLQKLTNIGLWLESSKRRTLAETLAGRRLRLAFDQLLFGPDKAASDVGTAHALALFQSAIEPVVLRARGCAQASLVPEVLRNERFFLDRLPKSAAKGRACGAMPPPPGPEH